MLEHRTIFDVSSFYKTQAGEKEAVRIVYPSGGVITSVDILWCGRRIGAGDGQTKNCYCCARFRGLVLYALSLWHLREARRGLARVM